MTNSNGSIEGLNSNEAAAISSPDGSVAVLIPALNCASTISDVVDQARKFVRLIFVIDDGSADSTAARAVEAGAHLLSHPMTRGKGSALLTGMRELSRRGIARALTMDGDGQHLADQIPVLLAVSNDAPDSLVIGARILEGVPTTPMRRFGNRFADRWVRIACGRELADTQSGFRVYPVERTLSLPLRARRFAFETEVLIRAVGAGIEIKSVPTRVYYPPAEERVSHYRPFIDTIRIIFVVLGLIFGLW